MLLTRNTSVGYNMVHTWWKIHDQGDPTKLYETLKDWWKGPGYLIEVLEVEITDLKDADYFRLKGGGNEYLKLWAFKDYQRREPKYVRPSMQRMRNFADQPHLGCKYDRHYRAYRGNGMFYWPVWLKIVKVHHSDIGRGKEV